MIVDRHGNPAGAAAPDTRLRHLVIGFGTNGVGKSYLAEMAIREWTENNPNAPVFAIGKKKGQFWVKGAGENKKLLFDYVRQLTNHGQGPSKNPAENPLVPLEGAFLLLDDGDGSIPERLENTPYYELCTEHRHQRLDLWLNCHRPQKISKDWILAAHYIYCFAIGEVHAYEYLGKLITEIEGKDVENLLTSNPPREKGEFIKITKDPDHRGDVKVERWTSMGGLRRIA